MAAARLQSELDREARIKHDEGFNARLVSYRRRTILSLCKGAEILELGCGDGLITEGLAQHFDEVVAVDGSATRIARTRRRVGQYAARVTFVVSLLEDFEPNGRFDTIIISEILEHLTDPIAALSRAKGWLKEAGLVIVVVPNASSLHRRVGETMGLLSNLRELKEQDYRVGHKRYYDVQMLKEHIARSGLVMESMGGILLKPLSNEQMATLSSEVTDALYEVGKELPAEYCAEIWVRCVVPKRNQE